MKRPDDHQVRNVLAQELHTRFDPGYLAEISLSDAYAHLVPPIRRRLSALSAPPQQAQARSARVVKARGDAHPASHPGAPRVSGASAPTRHHRTEAQQCG
jgi:hypothetical protein